ncbi:DUF6255 family natural product biosynthesis protein [Streptomyces sp. NPDC053079]|uniref:DUF6255 family natural product biosynthesis protein n=1 Tax=Streptomyces sp. NPDC053079 TaxID=3365697 RepID=UPI0037CDA7A3
MRGQGTARCAHRSGWRHTGGEACCEACGARRFSDYGALRPSGLPHAVTPDGPARRAADRAAAGRVGEAMRRVRPRSGHKWHQHTFVRSLPVSGVPRTLRSVISP